MQNESDDKLEKLIHQELAKLSELQAPQTLIPRVMEAIRIEGAKPWWQRSWFGWPFGVRVASLGFALSLLALMFSSLTFLAPDLGASTFGSQTIAVWLAPFALAGDIISTLAGAVVVILNAVGKFWMFLSLAIAFLMYTSCVGIGTLCFRLATIKR